MTEYGIADLHGKSVRERTLALIHIAHPKFRDDLMREARERRLVHPDQIALPPGLLPSISDAVGAGSTNCPASDSRARPSK